MVLVEESIHTLKMIYNSRVIGLRDLKRRMVERMRNDYVRIAEINEKMGIKETLNPPQIKVLTTSILIHSISLKSIQRTDQIYQMKNSKSIELKN